MDWTELYRLDITEQTDEDLSEAIKHLKEFRIKRTGCPTMSASECNMLLKAYYGEQRRRSSEKLTKTAIRISVASFMLAAASIALNAPGIIGN